MNQIEKLLKELSEKTTTILQYYELYSSGNCTPNNVHEGRELSKNSIAIAKKIVNLSGNNHILKNACNKVIKEIQSLDSNWDSLEKIALENLI